MIRLDLVVRAVLSAVFIVASISKLRDRARFQTAVGEFGVGKRLMPVVASTLPILEMAVAAILLPSSTALLGSWAALVLLLIFTAAIAYNMFRGRRPNCQCFGQLNAKPIGWTTIARNGVLAGFAVFSTWAAFRGQGVYINFSSTPSLIGLVGAALILVVAIEGWFLFHLFTQNGRLLIRLEAIEQRLGQGQPNHMQPNPSGHAHNPPIGLPIGTPAPAVSLPDVTGRTVSLQEIAREGKPVLLLFMDPGCGPCTALVPELAGWVREFKNVFRVAIISRGTREDNVAKFAGSDISPILLQKASEVAEQFGTLGTPMALVITPDGRIGSASVGGADAIRQLVADTVARSSLMLQNQTGLQIGTPAPVIPLRDLDGRAFDIKTFKGKATILIFWNPDCGFCQKLFPELKSTLEEMNGTKPLVVFISTGSQERNRPLALAAVKVALDDRFDAGRAFGAGGTPSAVRIDDAGRIASPMAVGGAAVLSLFREA